VSDTYTIAIDAMGGDDAPGWPVLGAVLAARKGDVRVLLVGDQAEVSTELAKHDAAGLPIEIVPSEGVVVEGENPARSLLAKPKSSIAVSVGLVKEGIANAAVSMGSTGATMAAGVIGLGLFPGLERPTLGGPFIALAPHTTIIDLGANVDSKPSQLLSFAALGATFERIYHGIESPRVALLSVGSEEGKGNRQTKEAFPLLQQSSLNFIGNIEGHELFMDKADVVVCDGFVGNVLLKFTEGLAQAAAAFLSKSVGADASAVQQIRSLASAAEHAGGPLFGINGLVIAGHGRANSEAIAASVKLARFCLDNDLIGQMRLDLTAAIGESA
jgi:glycerol-3-phosphate acyltransferase PlsX